MPIPVPFVLEATLWSGIQKHDLVDYLTDNPDTDFIPPEAFIGCVDDLVLEDALVVAIFDPLKHQDIINDIYSKFTVKHDYYF